MVSLSPNIYVENVQSTIDYYKLLGFSVVMTVPEDQVNPIWVMMQNAAVTILFESFENIAGKLPQINRSKGGSLLLYIKVENIQEYFDSVKDHVQILHPLQKTFYGATEFSIEDCNGYVLTFAD
jgi:uncharacterized glyoxalase superfamily protein PhnB